MNQNLSVKKNYDWIQNQNGIDQFLTKNWKYWDLIKFIHGYGCKYGGWDGQMDFIYYPIAFKAFGIPYQLTHYYEHYINAPARFAFMCDSSILGLPDDVIKLLKQGLYGEVLILPGNCIDVTVGNLEGVKKDLEYGKRNPVEANLKYIEIYLPLRGNRIYFFKGGVKG